MKNIFTEYGQKVALRTDLCYKYARAKKFKVKIRYALPNSDSKIYNEQELYTLMIKASDEIIELKRKIRRMLKSEEKNLSFEEKRRRDYEKKNN
jgi:hypothetical protein